MPDRDRHEQFVALLEQSKKLIYKVCFAYSASLEDRQDLFQEIVFQLWRSFEKFDAKMKFSTWLYRIALNTAISHVRRMSRRYRRERLTEEHILELTPAPKAADSDSDDLEALKRQIDRLKEMDKALVVLHLEGNSHREVAEILGISESNVGTRLNRVKQSLRDSLVGER